MYDNSMHLKAHGVNNCYYQNRWWINLGELMKSFLQVTNYILLFVIILTVPGVVLSQGNTSTQFSPPIVNIELSNVEPRPSGVVGDITFPTGGGPGDTPEYYSTRQIEWSYLPRDIEFPSSAFPSTLVACGFSSLPDNPHATLTTPSGSNLNMVGIEDPDQGCWIYAVGWSYGMELGEYTLVVEYSSQKLTHTWIIDYPDISTFVRIDDEQILLMGFSPNEVLGVNFYDVDGEGNGTYIASRSVPVDDYVFRFRPTRTPGGVKIEETFHPL